MRLYRNFKEAISETKRDLKEMGILVKTRTMQNKVIVSDPDYDTYEIQNLVYSVLRPRIDDIPDVTQPWSDAEFEERITAKQINPGMAYKLRPEIWNEFLNEKGQFDYTYNERFNGPIAFPQKKLSQIHRAAKALLTDPSNRRTFISIWDVQDIMYIDKEVRVPCSLGYYFQIRDNELHMTYLQRSCDFITHFQNDIYLASRLQYLMANMVHLPVGVFTHWVGSMHIYHKDVEGVF